MIERRARTGHTEEGQSCCVEDEDRPLEPAQHGVREQGYKASGGGKRDVAGVAERLRRNADQKVTGDSPCEADHHG